MGCSRQPSFDSILLLPPGASWRALPRSPISSSNHKRLSGRWLVLFGDEKAASGRKRRANAAGFASPLHAIKAALFVRSHAIFGSDGCSRILHPVLFLV